MKKFRPHEMAIATVRRGGSDVFPNPGTAVNIIARALSEAYAQGFVDWLIRDGNELR